MKTITIQINDDDYQNIVDHVLDAGERGRAWFEGSRPMVTVRGIAGSTIPVLLAVGRERAIRRAQQVRGKAVAR